MGEGYSYSADYWSLGVCLYEFICGFLPFCDGLNDPLEIYVSIIENEIVFPSSVKDNEFKDLIIKLLSKDINKRVCSLYSILAHNWFANFEIDKLINMALKTPYIPKLKNNIKIKTSSYNEFLLKKSTSDYVPLDEGKYNDEEVWFSEFDSY